jgi:Tol biopolymer transport system component
VNANRSSALLRFLVIETLEGRSEYLKEYVLGVQALGRPESFDPRIDPIARVEASRLRNKLDLTYADPTEQPSVRIRLPKGTYVPEFAIESVPEKVGHPTGLRRTYVAAGLAAAFLAGLTLTLFLNTGNGHTESLRVSILPPHDADLRSLAVSPDGQFIAIAAGSVGRSHLFLRHLATSFQPVMLTGTEDASFPFWSPDGHSIGFFAEHKLKVLDINGGEPHAVADAPLGRGGAWTPDGKIIFAPGGLGPLVCVLAKGGKTVPLTALSQSDGEVSHRWPVLLPDGRRLGYLAQNRDPALDAVVAIDLNAPNKRSHVVSANSSMAFSRLGRNRLRVLFLRDGALLEQLVTESQLAAIGGPATVAAQVNFDPLDRYALFSASLMNSVAFVPGTPFRFCLQWVNRSGGEAGAIPGDADYYALKISPDGSQLLTNRTDSRTGSTGVWLVDLVRGSASPVTTGGVDFFPVWSPDGFEVAFAKSDGTAERGMRLKIVTRTGGESRLALDVKGPVFPSDWSNDGTFLAYTGYKPLAQVTVLSIRRGATREVWSYSPSGHSAGGAVFKPTRSRQAPQWIAYTSDESGRNEIYLQSFSSNRAKLQISVSGGDRPVWRSDGRELYFVDDHEEICAVSVSENGVNLGAPRRLFKLSGSQQAVPPYALDYAVSPNGQEFLIRREDPQAEHAVINLIR